MARARITAALACAGLGLAGSTTAQSLLYALPGQGKNDLFGMSVAAAGDVNGDGLADVVIGADQSPHGLGSPPTGAGYARVVSGTTGALLYAFHGDAGDDWFGTAVCGPGDVNGDGYDDIAVLAPQPGSASYPPYVQGTPPGPGYLRILSGANGAVLTNLVGSGTPGLFGHSMAAAGDVNADGFPDIIVGEIGGLVWGYDPGIARIYSGLDGSLLHQLSVGDDGDWFGNSVDGAGDVDGDGYDDVVVGAPYFGPPVGLAAVYSGQSGLLIRAWLGNSIADEFGFAVAGAGDVNGDGVPDLVIAAPCDEPAGYPLGQNLGSVEVYSGVGGGLLQHWSGTTTTETFGHSISGAGDVDADGHADVLVGAWFADGPVADSGMAFVYSGSSGAQLFAVAGDTQADLFGCAVAGVGDANGDGSADVIVGAYGDDPNGDMSGSARVFSGTKLALVAQPQALSLSAGGTQVFALDAGAVHAGKPYLLLGSASGTAPGIPVDGLVLPLNLDAWLLFTLAHPNVAPLAHSLGVLDTSGKSVATLSLPPGSPASLAGTALHHAFVVLSPQSVQLASNPVPLTLDP